MGKSLRRKKHEDHENHERWLVSYADFITLLFAFFVVLYATSTQNKDKEKSFEESIREKMKMVGLGGPSGGAVAGGSNRVSMSDGAGGVDGPSRKNISEEILDSVARYFRKVDPEGELFDNVDGDSGGARVSLAQNIIPTLPNDNRPIDVRKWLATVDHIIAYLAQTEYNLVFEWPVADFNKPPNLDQVYKLVKYIQSKAAVGGGLGGDRVSPNISLRLYSPIQQDADSREASDKVRFYFY